jgi:hypothetical protein
MALSVAGITILELMFIAGRHLSALAIASLSSVSSLASSGGSPYGGARLANSTSASVRSLSQTGLRVPVQPRSRASLVPLVRHIERARSTAVVALTSNVNIRSMACPRGICAQPSSHRALRGSLNVREVIADAEDGLARS